MADAAKPAPRSRAQIQADLDAARARLATNVEDLIGRVHPTAIRRREVAKVKALARAEVDNVRSQVVNPDGSLRLDRVVAIVASVAGAVTFIAVLRAIARRARR